jgi:hypothetical protein
MIPANFKLLVPSTFPMASPATVYESLPPRVVGEPTGTLRIKLHKVEGAAPLSTPGTSIRFEWWGQHGGAVSLPAPWKAGMAEEEAVFPLRAGRASVAEYLKDMNLLTIDVVDANARTVGTAVLPVGDIAASGTSFRGPLAVKESKGVNRRQIGEVVLSVALDFTAETGAVVGPGAGAGASAPPSSSSSSSAAAGGGTGKARPTLVDQSPARVDKSAKAAAASAAAGGPTLSSFQRHEALVLTDNADQVHASK